MTDPRFLIYFPDPYAVGNSSFFVSGKDLLRLSGDDLSKESTLVTFEVHSLIDELRRLNVQLPSKIVDLSDGIRLLTGISRADGGERKWNFWRRIKPFFEDENKYESIKKIHAGQTFSSDTDESMAFAAAFEIALKKFWPSFLNDLERSGEGGRFWDIEVPVAQPFYHRQRYGIPVNHATLDSHMEAASSDKYIAYQRVSDELKISASGLTYWNILDKIDATDFVPPQETSEGYVLRDQMKMASNTSDFAKNFVSYLDSAKDLDILSRLSEDQEKVFPTFHPIGTISSRILVSDPFLQQLKRSFRGVFIAENANTLKYFDYSQFEPGIMASLSGDHNLTELYNGGDIYKALSIALYGDESNRQLCKRVFLAFSYGMSIRGIASLLTTKISDDAQKKEVEDKISLFFSKFSRLLEFKQSLEVRLQKYGKIGSLLGNFRYRTGTGKLNAKERRWAVSQHIQGTASLIFKDATIRICEEFGFDSLLLPVHDALLLQLPDSEATKEIEGRISDIMISSFAKFCPNVKARVTVGEFAS